MGSKIFVDDNREFPEGFECFRSFGGAVMLMQYTNDEIDLISLDFDLGGKNIRDSISSNG